MTKKNSTLQNIASSLATHQNIAIHLHPSHTPKYCNTFASSRYSHVRTHARTHAHPPTHSLSLSHTHTNTSFSVTVFVVGHSFCCLSLYAAMFNDIIYERYTFSVAYHAIFPFPPFSSRFLVGTKKTIGKCGTPSYPQEAVWV